MAVYRLPPTTYKYVVKRPKWRKLLNEILSMNAYAKPRFSSALKSAKLSPKDLVKPSLKGFVNLISYPL